MILLHLLHLKPIVKIYFTLNLKSPPLHRDINKYTPLTTSFSPLPCLIINSPPTRGGLAIHNAGTVGTTSGQKPALDKIHATVISYILLTILKYKNLNLINSGGIVT